MNAVKNRVVRNAVRRTDGGRSVQASSDAVERRLRSLLLGQAAAGGY